MSMTKKEKERDRARIWRLQGVVGSGERVTAPLRLLDQMNHLFDTKWADQWTPDAWVERVQVSGDILEAFTDDLDRSHRRTTVLKRYPDKRQEYLAQLDRLQGLIDHLKGELRD